LQKCKLIGILGPAATGDWVEMTPRGGKYEIDEIYTLMQSHSLNFGAFKKIVLCIS